jgi:hypothetical protein
MHDVIVIDNAVDKETQDLIENKIFSADTAWILSRTVFYGSHPEVNNAQRKSLMAFTHPILDGVTNNVVDTNIELYHSVIKKYASEILHSRIQLQLPLITESQKLYGVPHVDGYRPFPYKVAVYYVNDSDGPTVLFKETINDTSPDEIKSGKITVDQSIEPKKGRVIIFNGDIYHAVGKPKNDLRCVINYNFI